MVIVPILSVLFNDPKKGLDALLLHSSIEGEDVLRSLVLQQVAGGMDEILEGFIDLL